MKEKYHGLHPEARSEAHRSRAQAVPQVLVCFRNSHPRWERARRTHLSDLRVTHPRATDTESENIMRELPIPAALKSVSEIKKGDLLIGLGQVVGNPAQIGMFRVITCRFARWSLVTGTQVTELNDHVYHMSEDVAVFMT
jgi:hypothetical protein